VERTEKALRLFQDTIDEWLECQRQWLYLETIFRHARVLRLAGLALACSGLLWLAQACSGLLGLAQACSGLLVI
jgi:hypothetical protein